MNSKLLKDGVIRMVSGILLLGILLFVPAGTIAWKEGWLLMGVLFLPMLAAGIVMYLKAPNLLRSRLSAKETQDEQKTVILLSGIMFLTAFITAGLNYRFGWLRMPSWCVTAACVIFLAAYALFGEVLRENEYLSRTVEVQEGQKVVSTGLYGIVRHPMYLATVFLFLSMPLILNSPISFVIMLVYLPIIAKRIRNEEEVLKTELEGYTEYMDKVRWRLIPLIW
ncbi:MAG: isoprenylcysteine carboxylmethyltransferase family protein [Solobacterium sp.]|nr:isoprenylcysteine carboxylmethyltransferase family protein [Solobacterium sp.]